MTVNAEVATIKVGTSQMTFSDYWNHLMRDGFQIEDLGALVRYGVRALCRWAADHIPGDDPAAKVKWVREQLKLTADKLIDQARETFFQGILAFVGYAFDEIVTRLAHGAIDWIVDNVIDGVIKFAYVDEVIEGSIKSDSYTQKVVSKANDDLPVYIETALLKA